MAETPSKNHLGYSDGLNLTLSLCLTYSVCIAALRTWIRKGNYGSDDLVILIATVVCFTHIICDYIALRHGLGQSQAKFHTNTDNSTLNAATLAAVVTFAASLYLSKCAVLTFLARITKAKRQVQLYHVVNSFVGVIGLVSILMLTADCPSRLHYYWAFSANRQSCPSQSARWQVFTLFDVITELLLLVLPTQLIWTLQMPLKRKATLLTAFYLRLPIVGLSVGRYYFTLRLNDSSADYGLISALVVIWIVIQLTYALAASTMSALKTFTESFNSSFGLGFARNAGEESYDMSNASSSTSGNAIKREKKAAAHAAAVGSPTQPGSSPAHLQSPGKANGRVEVRQCASEGQLRLQQEQPHPLLRLRPDREEGNTTHVSADPSHLGPESHIAISQGSDGTLDDMVIIRETEYSVEHQDHVPILHASRPRAYV